MDYAVISPSFQVLARSMTAIHDLPWHAHLGLEITLTREAKVFQCQELASPVNGPDARLPSSTAFPSPRSGAPQVHRQRRKVTACSFVPCLRIHGTASGTPFTLPPILRARLCCHTFCRRKHTLSILRNRHLWDGCGDVGPHRWRISFASTCVFRRTSGRGSRAAGWGHRRAALLGAAANRLGFLGMGSPRAYQNTSCST